MQFLEHPDLSRLSVLINELDVGDRILCGKLELFSTEDTVASSQENFVVSGCPGSIKKSTEPFFDYASQAFLNKGEKDAEDISCHEELNPHSSGTCEKGQELLFTLVTTLNKCFPDYDFSCVRPDVFVRIKDPMNVYTSVNYYLSFFAERAVPGLLNDLWGTICNVIDLTNTIVYSYNATQGDIQSTFHWGDGSCLFSFDYFFVDMKQRRVLFFACVTKRKQWVSSDANSSYRDHSKSDTSCMTSRTDISFDDTLSDDEEC